MPALPEEPTQTESLLQSAFARHVPKQCGGACHERASWPDGRSASDCAFALAEAKARRVAAHHPHGLIIGADQILVCDGAWFDKPASLADARHQLQKLRGRTHRLVTAACVVEGQACTWRGIASAWLTMREFSDAFLDLYLEAEGTSVLGSVGAYRLEGRGVQLFTRVEGDHFAILGLPLLELLSFLRERGALPS